MKRLIIKPACAGATRRAAAVSVMAGRLISMAKDGSALRKLISRVKAMEAGGISTKSVILWLGAPLPWCCPPGDGNSICFAGSQRQLAALWRLVAADEPNPGARDDFGVKRPQSPLFFAL